MNTAKISDNDIIGRLSHFLEEENNSIMLTGSIALGHGTTTSDLDVHVLVPLDRYIKIKKSIEWSIKSQLIEVIEMGSEVLDIEYICIDTVTEVLDKINREFSNNQNKKYLVEQISEVFDIDEFMTLVHRLYTGVPIYGKSIAEYVKNRIEISEYFSWKTRYLLELADILYQDFIGFIEVEDNDSVHYFSKTVFSKLLYAYLTSRKISMDREKWLIYNLRKYDENNNYVVQARQILLNANSKKYLNQEVYIDIYEGLRNYIVGRM